jgi:methionyl-tRNA formyltransferase
MANIIFMGTPDFAVATLQRLIAEHQVMAVITQPDRPAGRKQQLKASPVKEVALAHNIPVFQPEKLRKRDAIDALKAFGVPDAYVVAAFGQILPQEVLDIPKFGSINVHASLLPRWRGAAPIQAAIRAGDAESGVTIMKMDAGLDTGAMLTKVVVPLAADETGGTLHDKLALAGANLLAETLPRFFAGEVQPEAQDDALMTFAPRIEKHEGDILWGQSALDIDRLVRAFNPAPGTYTQWNGQRLKVISGIAIKGNAPIGNVVRLEDGYGVGTGAGIYQLQVVQMPGGKPLAIQPFVNGYPDFVNATLQASTTT